MPLGRQRMPQGQQPASALVTPEQVLKSLGALPEADRYVAAVGIYRSGRQELLRGVFSLGSPEAENLFKGTLEVAGGSYKHDGADFAYNMGRKETAAQIYDGIGADLEAAKVWKEAGNEEASRKSFLRAIEKKKVELSKASEGYDVKRRAEELVGLSREFGALADSALSHNLIEFLRGNRQYEISAAVLEEVDRGEDARQDWIRAAELAEIRDEFSHAADLFVKVGMPDKAIEVSLRGALRHEMKGEYGWAAQAYRRAGNPEKATENSRKLVEQLRRREDRDKEYAIQVAIDAGLRDLAFKICMENKWYGKGAAHAEALGDKEKAEALRMLDELTRRMH